MVRCAGMLVALSLLGSAGAASAQLDPLEVQKVRPNLFLLNGGAPDAATTVVFVRSKDVVIIDAKGPRPVWGEVIAAEVKLLVDEFLEAMRRARIKGALVERGLLPFIADNRIHVVPPCVVTHDEVAQAAEIYDEVLGTVAV